VEPSTSTSDSTKFSGLNRIAVVFEYVADAEGNTKSKLFVWKQAFQRHDSEGLGLVGWASFFFSNESDIGVPVIRKKFPVPLSREFGQKPERR
jgi:hypothetical protein